MLTRRLLLPFLAFVLASCSAPLSSTEPAPQPAPVTATPLTILATDTPPTPALTLELLKNAEVNVAGVSASGADVTRTVKLTDGAFTSGSDRTSTDYITVNMGQQVAFGDLNGDGAQDAAIIVGTGYGGTGEFVAVIAMLNQNGQPVFAGSAAIDDRPKVNSLSIQNGEILLDAVIHGPGDPGCCAAQPVTESFRLWGGKLTLTRFTSKTPGGVERIIKIDSPAPGSQLASPFTLSGSVSVTPFEKNLTCSIFLEGAPDPVVKSSITVNAADAGSPGSFALPLDFTAAGIHGNLRIEISDISAADGNPLALATLFVTAK
ncbi:MAG: Gmad2 immunoglobulin-like domain-containing protein [Anaerolineales bacterium]